MASTSTTITTTSKTKKSKARQPIQDVDPKTGKEYTFDSLEEWAFFHWLLEMEDMGVVKSWIYHPPTYLLIDKEVYIPLSNNKGKERSLLRAHSYTLDFEFTIDSKYAELFSKVFKIGHFNCPDENGSLTLYVDIKGAFSRYDGDRSFSINQKLLYMVYGIYVEKIVVKDLFGILGVPKRCLKTFKGNPSRIYGNSNLIPTVLKRYAKPIY